MKYDVFISYSRKDTAIADQICAAFDKVGISYFIDRQGIVGSGEFPEILADAILESQLFLFLASKNSYSSKYTKKEIFYAFNKKTSGTLFPYIIDNSTLPNAIELVFSDNNIRSINVHPIKTVLIDDVFNLLGREKPLIDSVSQVIQFSDPFSKDISIPEKFPEFGFKPVSEIWFSKITNKKLLYWAFGGLILFILFGSIMALFVEEDPTGIYFGGISIPILVLFLILGVRKSPNYSLSKVADYIQKNPIFPMFQKFGFPIFVKKEKFGVLDGNTNIIIPAEYDKLSWKTKNKILIAEQNEETFLIDIKGNRV